MKVFDFFVKNLSKIISVVLASSHPVTYIPEQAFFCGLASCHTPFLTPDQLTAFYPLPFQCCETSRENSFIGGFLPTSPPLKHFHPFCHDHFPHLRQLSALLPSSSGCILGLLNRAIPTFPQSATSSLTPFIPDSYFISNVITFYFFAAFLSVLAGSLLIIHFFFFLIFF